MRTMQTRRGFIGWLASMMGAGTVVAAGAAPRALPRREVDTDDADLDVDLDADLDAEPDDDAAATGPWTTEKIHQDFEVVRPNAITTVSVTAHQSFISRSLPCHPPHRRCAGPSSTSFPALAG